MVVYVFQAKTQRFKSVIRSYRASNTSGSVDTYRIEFVLSGIRRLCGTVSCAEIEHESNRVSLDLFRDWNWKDSSGNVGSFSTVPLNFR
jgi:hypothetical protein